MQGRVVPNRVYATIAQRLAVSDDGGLSFSQPETDLPEGAIEALASGEGTTLFAATSASGVAVRDATQTSASR